MKRLYIADALQHERGRFHLYTAEGVADCEIKQTGHGKAVQVFAHCAIAW